MLCSYYLYVLIIPLRLILQCKVKLIGLITQYLKR
nr:MAG TPA: hypothetical protein [Caudoviricetes sp.]